MSIFGSFTLKTPFNYFCLELEIDPNNYDPSLALYPQGTPNYF